ncbi:hypothetical protein BGX29_009142 [Mortierella sp. GBA35]|nr:hypothetical protein BGX29_009142 [Mortierella sp. GBA35]
MVIGRDIANELMGLRGQDIVHNDVKPCNLLLKNGHDVLADRGLSERVELNNWSLQPKTPDDFKAPELRPIGRLEFGRHPPSAVTLASS